MNYRAIFSACWALFICTSGNSAECNPVDERGKACDRPISVFGKRRSTSRLGEDGLSSTGVPAGGTAKLTCVDNPEDRVLFRGFESWWPKCY